MNHKITFQELIDEIAEQSGQPKEFTHDFVKELVSLIKESLEKDGNINIAGLGKFELKKMDEREGFNPQTEEKITIPAHNKIDFSPYKDLRELVNAPYAHMEPEEIEQEEGEATAGEVADEETESAPEIPPVDADEESGKEKAPWEEDMESDIEIDEEDPFGLNAKHKRGSPLSQINESGEEVGKDEEDIIEYTEGISAEEEKHTPEEEGEKQAELSEEAEAEDSAADEKYEPEEVVLSSGDSKDRADEQKSGKTERQEPENGKEIRTKTKRNMDFRDRSHRRQRSGTGFWIIAAAFIIILLAISAWYFMGGQGGTIPGTMDTQTVESPAQAEAETESQPAVEEQEDSGDGQAASAGDQPANGTPQDQQADVSSQNQTADTQQPSKPDPKNRQVETITVAKGQTLWGLADTNYDNPYLWPWIYNTNSSRIDNPNLIYIGQSLDIPRRSGADNGLSTNDSLQVALGYVDTYTWYKENELENAKFYLYTAIKYHRDVLEYTEAEIDDADLAFANRAQ